MGELSMILAFLTELGHGFLRLWMNPVFYMALVLSILLAFRRVKKERSLFHTRVYDLFSDVYHTFIPGLLAGLILYGFFIGAGFMLDEGVIALIMVITFLLSLAFRPSLLSPAFVLFLTAVVIIFLPEVETNVDLVNRWLAEIQIGSLPYIFLLMSVLLIVEAMLILFQAKCQPSPRRVAGKRGKPIGGFETNRVWLVPTFLLIPGFGLERISWWPFFGWGDSFTFMLVPFLIGYHQFQTFTLPEKAIKQDGRRLAFLGLAALPFAIVTLLYYWITVAFIGMAILCLSRFALYMFVRNANQARPAYFTQKNKGIQILAIIPKSPAADMNLKVGEVIRRVNGIDVKNTSQFYEALQANATYIKLDVMDGNGEIRFEQRAHYDDDHHELGLLFVDEPRTRFEFREKNA